MFYFVTPHSCGHFSHPNGPASESAVCTTSRHRLDVDSDNPAGRGRERGRSNSGVLHPDDDVMDTVPLLR